MSVQRARQFRKNLTPPEARLWAALRSLRPLGYHFRRQVPLGPYYADFCCHKRCLVVEVDGQTHFVDGAPERDARRDAFIGAQGYKVLHVPNAEVLDNLDGVMRLILSIMESRRDGAQ
ncbi:endonuclease domain-containing protein [Devosia sediminis]|uniref:Endonuclease domain-containing protein n=1 Tax=Devosia sediminis TaxID=2798801 RepID=A0A934IZA9_9HYPH|nr:endonuclease domain-containing protein [Devosia sediminis]